MFDTSNLRLPMLQAAQAQKHVTLNDSLQALDVLVQLSVIDRAQLAPPGAPIDGARYLVPDGASGAWSGHAHEIAAFQDGVWVFHAARDGWRVYVAAEGRMLTFAHGRWRETYVHDGFGAGLAFGLVSEDHVLAAGATSETAITIPERAILFGVTGLVSQAVTGVSSFSVGVAADAQRFGSGIGTGVNSQVNGVGTPSAYYSATPIRFTATGGGFTGGSVRVAAHFVRLQIPDFI